MSHHEFDSTDTKKFTLTAFLSFVTVFFFLMIMMNCSGSFKPGGEEHEATKAHDTEHAGHTSPAPAPAEHKADSIKVK